ncbi:MAG: hypothetical protein R8J84_00840 [Mariprofundales bacterium]
MTDQTQPRWRPSKRDALFLIVVASVITALALGDSGRTTKSVPDDSVHQQATSRAACMSCHAADGVKPQPAGHTAQDQCFLCHSQPASWKASR